MVFGAIAGALGAGLTALIDGETSEVVLGGIVRGAATGALAGFIGGVGAGALGKFWSMLEEGSP